MMTALIAKELRAVLPASLAASVTMALAIALRFPSYRQITLVVFWYGAAGLGALVMGHEYARNTLPMLLSQPVGRGKLLAAKFAALSAALAIPCLTLAWFGPTEVFRFVGFDPQHTVGWRLWTFPVLAALCLAPWFSMLGRSALSGLVFSIAAPAAIWIGSSLTAMARYGLVGADAQASDEFRIALLTEAFLACCATGAVMTWRAFMTLEVSGLAASLNWPAGSRSRSAAVVTSGHPRRYPWWALASKELRLQSLTFVVAAFSVLGWIAILLARRSAPEFSQALIFPVAIMCGLVIAVMTGALASAQEREFGTLETQALLPVSPRAQWTVKLLVVHGLTLLLAVGVPLGAQVVLQPGEGDLLLARMQDIVGVLILTAMSLYVSTLCRGGLRALVAAPVVIAGAAAAGTFVAALGLRTGMLAFGPDGVEVLNRAQAEILHRHHVGESLAWITAVIVAGAALRFAARNHRSSEQGAGRIVRQAVTLATVIIVGATSSGTMEALWVGSFYHTGETPQLARLWLGAHSGAWRRDEQIVIQASTGVVPMSRTGVLVLDEVAPKSIDDHRRERTRFIVLRVPAQERDSPDVVATYEHLRRQAVVRREFRPSTEHPGPHIVILEVPR